MTLVSPVVKLAKTREETAALVQQTMSEMFEIEPDRIQGSSHLVDDLGLDSIDAIDMAVKMQELTGHRTDEQALRSLRTVDDVVTLAQQLFERG